MEEAGATCITRPAFRDGEGDMHRIRQQRHIRDLQIIHPNERLKRSGPSRIIFRNRSMCSTIAFANWKKSVRRKRTAIKRDDAMRGRGMSGGNRTGRGRANRGGGLHGRCRGAGPVRGRGHSGGIMQDVSVNEKARPAFNREDAFPDQNSFRQRQDRSGNQTKRTKGMKAYVDTAICTGCGICADTCPRAAIIMGDCASVDADRCAGCGVCVDVCPVGALSMK